MDLICKCLMNKQRNATRMPIRHLREYIITYIMFRVQHYNIIFNGKSYQKKI